MSATTRAGNQLSSDLNPVEFLNLGLCEYQETMDQMRTWTNGRDDDTPDQIWFLEHPPVYTQGVSCTEIPRLDGIPLVKSDRGGQITYHGPGQLIAYFMIDLKRRKMGVRQLVRVLEAATMRLLSDIGLEATTRAGAPGVYLRDQKIAALGLRVRSGRSYHGLSLNVAMDLEPFQWINPCGYTDLQVTSIEREGISLSVDEARQALMRCLAALL
jgi:lipoyl(octanoyl) transferase